MREKLATVVKKVDHRDRLINNDDRSRAEPQAAVLPRAGDFYGRSVNLASRITAIARPSSVLVTTELRERLGDRFRFSNAGRRRLKGIELPATVFRARGLDEDQLS